jgi:glucose dehydrogenase
MDPTKHTFDVVIVGTGIAGAILAKQLGKYGWTVLLLESGDPIPNGREALMERFFLSTSKLPEAPYPDSPFAPRAAVEHLFTWPDPSRSYLDQSESRIPFGSTYERRAGGTMWHWMGTTLRFLPSDFRLKTTYGRGNDWPISYDELGLKIRGQEDGKNVSYYDMAENEIGVSASVEDQKTVTQDKMFNDDRNYPNPAIPISRVDQFFDEGLKAKNLHFDGELVRVVPTPAGRNSQPYRNRRACAGNTNCVPICPIEAKYDPTVTLHAAFNYQNVRAEFNAVATRLVKENGKIVGVEYVKYDRTENRVFPAQIARGKIVVVAANGIETPKLLLLSGLGEQNPNIGRCLIDHPFFLRCGLTPKEKKIYPYRGPLSTAGLDSLRDGGFRKDRAAFRIEIGNDGWALCAQDPAKSLLTLIDGANGSPGLYGRELLDKLSDLYSRQCRIGFELEQLPDPANRVELSRFTDALGIRRPKIFYSVSDYEALGLARAAVLADRVFSELGIEDKTDKAGFASYAYWEGKRYEFMGAGHVMGTCRMGKDPKDSVVNELQQSHEHKNLFIVGSSVFPTGATANPSLTIAALAYWAADTIRGELPA